MIIASYVLHYGKEHLAWSIRSIQDQVDAIQILYSPRPSFSYQSDVPCPESEEELKAEAHRFLRPGKKLYWDSGTWPSEGAHRDQAMGMASLRGASLILVVDADELWDPVELRFQLDAASRAPERDTLVPFVHFWRSFNYICSDPSRPVRIVRPSGVGLRYSDQWRPVLHYGYAQSEAIVRYKIAIHGHRGEWRPEWLAEKFLAWSPDAPAMKDVHPTCGWNSSFNDYFWNVRPVDPPTKMVADPLVFDHPYRVVEVIR